MRRPVTVGDRRGFTLVEVLIVIVLLGILIGVVVPQFADRSEDARLASLDSNLTQLRSAVERYYQEHHNVFPGQNDPASGQSPAANSSAAFVQQLTRFTDRNGVVSDSRTDVYRYGPYLRDDQLPVNPFTGDNSLVADTSTQSLTADLYDGTSSWKFAVQIGKLVANDDGKHAQR